MRRPPTKPPRTFTSLVAPDELDVLESNDVDLNVENNIYVKADIDIHKHTEKDNDKHFDKSVDNTTKDDNSTSKVVPKPLLSNSDLSMLLFPYSM